MVAQANAIDNYTREKIMAASPAELTLMLYEGAIRFGNIALVGLEKKQVEKAHVNITKMQRIITEFRCTLDMKYEVAKDFDRVYVYLESRLVEADLYKDADILSEVLEHIRAMRDNWKEVMKRAKV